MTTAGEAPVERDGLTRGALRWSDQGISQVVWSGELSGGLIRGALRCSDQVNSQTV